VTFETKRLFIAWQEPLSRRWFPIGLLTVETGSYRFQYIFGALDAQSKGGFQPFGAFPDLYQSYESKKLFSLFSKRVLSPSRPDYPDFVSWLGLFGSEIDPIELLARSGGQSVTDRFDIFPFPEKTKDGKYHSLFFVHGLRYLPESAVERINRLKAGERLRLAIEFQNPFDAKAMLLITEDRVAVGYCPRYLLHDVDDPTSQAEKLVVTVEQDVSKKVPLQFRLLSGLTAAWDEFSLPFLKKVYQPITKPYRSYAESDSPNVANICRDGDG
jgi:hypothetical protein